MMRTIGIAMTISVIIHFVLLVVGFGTGLAEEPNWLLTFFDYVFFVPGILTDALHINILLAIAIYAVLLGAIVGASVQIGRRFR